MGCETTKTNLGGSIMEKPILLGEDDKLNQLGTAFDNLFAMVQNMEVKLDQISLEVSLLSKVVTSKHEDSVTYHRARIIEFQNMKGRHIALENGNGVLYDKAQSFTDKNRKEAEKEGGMMLKGFNDAHLDFEEWVEEQTKLLVAQNKLITPE